MRIISIVERPIVLSPYSSTVHTAFVRLPKSSSASL